MHNQEYFIIPFFIGLVFILGFLFIKYSIWIFQLSKFDKLRIIHSVFSNRTVRAVKIVFMESLLHRKIFKTNPMLGYMHASFALGWLLLIVVGHVETSIAYKSFFEAPWTPIFFRYFNHNYFYGANLFAHVMDAILLYILSGVFLAWFKRIKSNFFGIKRATKLKPRDRIALLALWSIFPARLLAESSTAAQFENGGFLTQTIGNLLFQIPHVSMYETVLWWWYSLSLGIFFITLPFTRYMHIPTEVLFIFLKEYGLKLKKEFNSLSKIQVYSCSRCGICIDACQMHSAHISNNQSVYILKNIRDQNLTDRKLFNCLLCGRCEDVCPVGIHLNDLRITLRLQASKEINSEFTFLKQPKIEKSKVIYFAGCMTQVTPNIPNALEKICKQAQINFLQIDKNQVVCCGRPLMLSGQINAAKKLIQYNRNLILETGAETLIVSCPICYKTFKEDYELSQITILHHTEFLEQLITNNKIELLKNNSAFAYHDPCELGRGSGKYEQARAVLKSVGEVQTLKSEKSTSLCCGGSLADLSLSITERNKILQQTLSVLEQNNPDCIVTACPLCKKTLTKQANTVVKDIAEIVEESLITF